MKKHALILICILLVFLPLSIYWQIGMHAFIDYDDFQYIVSNSLVKNGLSLGTAGRAFTEFYASNWHPFTWLSHMLDCEIFGLASGPHHAVNMFIHILNGLILFFLLYLMTREEWKSAFVAVLFAVHPLHVESVAWASERKDLLCTFFCFLTMLAYYGYTRSVKGKLWYWLLAILLYAVALMSKPMAVTLPFLLVLLDFWPLRRIDIASESSFYADIRRAFFEKLPFFVLCIAGCVLTVMAQKAGDSVVPLEALPFSKRLLNAFISYVAYLRNMIFPVNLTLFYPYPEKVSVLKGLLSFSFLGIVTGLFVFLGRRWRFCITGWFWYLGMLVPVIGIVQVGEQPMADRYTYMPLIGIFIILAWGIPLLMGGLKYRKKVLCISALAVIMVLTVFSWGQTALWKNNFTLFKHAAGLNDRDCRIYSKLGTAYMAMGRKDEAEKYYRKSLKLEPAFPFANCNLACLLSERGRHLEAEIYFLRALESKPDFVDAMNNYAVSLVFQKRLASAAEYFKKVLDIEPGNYKANLLLGNIYLMERDYAGSLEYFRRAVAAESRSAVAWASIGEACAALKRHKEAENAFRKALRFSPGMRRTLNNLGNALVFQKKFDEAAEYFRKSIEQYPDSPEGFFYLGNLCYMKGDLASAVLNYREALRKRPGFAPAKKNLLKAERVLREKKEKERSK